MGETLRIRQRPANMPLDGWIATRVFMVRWQAGIFSFDLVGVYADKADAEATFAKRQAAGHSGSKAEPQTQRRDECISQHPASVRGNEFVPVGSWFHGPTNEIVTAAGLSIDQDETVCTFGDAPPDIGR